MPSPGLSLNLRSFRLNPESMSAASSPAPSPRPQAVEHNPYDGLIEPDVPVSQLTVTQDGMLTTTRPAPSPPFRLLPPSAPGSIRSPSPFVEPSRRSSPGGYLMPEVSAPPSITALPRRGYGADEDSRRLQRELRSRPLPESEYGRHIVGLLTMQWVVAPSCLAATVFPLGTPESYVDDCAHYINLLVCGTEAFRHGPAGVLGLYSITQLNRLLVRSGLSPIAPLPAPANWAPLAARMPPDFLLEGFAIRPSHNLQDQDAE